MDELILDIIAKFLGMGLFVAMFTWALLSM